jgi:hypothetical protein
MHSRSATRVATLALLVSGLACAKNSNSEQTGAAPRDSATAGISDSAKTNQTKSGVTDSSGKSTMGPGVTRTRPDQGQPVTSKGDTINKAVDSSKAADSSTTSR